MARTGAWPRSSHLLAIDLDARLRADGSDVLAASRAILRRAGSVGGTHRDPFDRIIVATAPVRGLPVASKRAALDLRRVRQETRVVNRTPARIPTAT